MWHKFAPSLEVNKRIHGNVDGRFVTAIRLGNGKLKCIDTTCYHAGGPLGVGPIEELNGEACITCPWHSYPVSLEDGGKLYQALELDKATKKLVPAGWKKKEHAQRVHGIEERAGGEVWVRLSQATEKFDSDEYSSSAICAERAKATNFGAPQHGTANGVGLMSSGQVFQEQRWRPCKVLAVSREGSEGVRIRIQGGSNFAQKKAPILMMNAAELFSHSYIVVRIGSVHRSYTPLISVNGEDDEVVTLSVRVYPHSTVGTSLTRLKPGDILDMRKAGETDPPSAKTQSLAAAGFFPQKLKRALLIAGGSGITPILAACKSILENTPDAVITVLCFDRAPETVLCAEVLDAIHNKFKFRMKTFRAFSQKSGVSAPGGLVTFKQKITADFIKAHFRPILGPGEEKFIVSWSGPPGFMEATSEELHKAGFTDDVCFFVQFVG